MRRIYYFLAVLLMASNISAEDIYINTVAELQALATAVNSGNDYSGQTIKLNVDIDLQGINWIPIGKSSNKFNGTFDGQGHQIHNLTVNIEGTTTGNVAGLFGWVGTSGTVQRVCLNSGAIKVNTKSSENIDCWVGGIVGHNEGSVAECAIKPSVKVRGDQTQAYVGGIVGINQQGTIINCYSQGQILTSKTAYDDDNFLGGIVGYNNGTLQYVYTTATITETETATDEGVWGDNTGYYSSEADYYPHGTVTNLTGFTLDGKLNILGDYSIWTFADGELPQLTAFSQSVLLGDVNCDGQINLADVTSLVNRIILYAPATPNADVNHDGTLSVEDVAILVKMLLTQE